MAIQEDVIYEGRPHVGDLIVNTILLGTVIWVVFWVGAVINYAFTRYRFTNRRITVEGGWQGRNRTDVVYREVRSIQPIATALIGAIFGYGTLLITLQDGAKLELKAVPKFREIADFVQEKIDTYVDKKPKSATKR